MHVPPLPDLGTTWTLPKTSYIPLNSTWEMKPGTNLKKYFYTGKELKTKSCSSVSLGFSVSFFGVLVCKLGISK